MLLHQGRGGPTPNKKLRLRQWREARLGWSGGDEGRREKRITYKGPRRQSLRILGATSAREVHGAGKQTG